MQRWLIAAALAAISAAPAHAQIVKCVDERGVTHYTDKPGPGCKGGPVDIRPAPPISGKAQERKEDLSDAERDFQRRRLEREGKDQDEARKLEAQKRRCASMHAQYQNLSSARRVYRTNEKGERVYIEDAERERRSAQLKADIAQQCPF
ncbi:MAG: DUF4124 domain-containing protein [Betaproteobacteria bacterium]|nr:DUF4124 domain-containing protein [Betaproteobacteria bacterium]